jgi:hypothetical protein
MNAQALEIARRAVAEIRPLDAALAREMDALLYLMHYTVADLKCIVARAVPPVLGAVSHARKNGRPRRTGVSPVYRPDRQDACPTPVEVALPSPAPAKPMCAACKTRPAHFGVYCVACDARLCG